MLDGMLDGIQSALHAQGVHAADVLELTWVLFAGAAIVFVLVIALVLLAAFGSRSRLQALNSSAFIVGGGIVFPTVTLGALLVYGLVRADALEGKASTVPLLTIEVIGEQWWWRLRYLDERGALDFVGANEIRIPAGRPVEFRLRSADVIHSFWVPNLAGKRDVVPGRVNKLRVLAPRPGTFRGQCAEYCGGPHALMAFYVVAEAPQAYARWAERQREPIAPPEEPLRAEGAQLFMQRCAACHSVRGTPAEGRRGPDLTHVATRGTIAAGLLPTNRGTVAAWISASQRLKPHNLMPSFRDLSGIELRSLASFLLDVE